MTQISLLALTPTVDTTDVLPVVASRRAVSAVASSRAGATRGVTVDEPAASVIGEHDHERGERDPATSLAPGGPGGAGMNTPVPFPPPASSVTAATSTRRAVRAGALERDLYEQYVERIFRLAARMTGDRSLAEDLTQDIFLRAFGRLRQFRGDAAVGTWLHRVAISVILNAIRTRRRAEQREVTLESTPAIAVTTSGLEPDTRQRVRAAVAALPPELRIVVLLYDVEGYAHNEIASLLAISSGASRTRLMRARQLLRATLPLEAGDWR